MTDDNKGTPDNATRDGLCQYGAADGVAFFACRVCQRSKPVAQFKKRSNRLRGHESICLDCYRVESAKRRASDVEKVRESNRRWYAANRAAILERQRIDRAANPERQRAKAAAWAKKLPAGYYEAYRRANPDKFLEYRRSFLAKNPGYSSATAQEWRRRVKAAPGDGVTLSQWTEIIVEHDHRCAYCLRQHESLAMDHVVPVSRGGWHDVSNVVPACRPCNSAKKDRPVWQMLTR